MRYLPHYILKEMSKDELISYAERLDEMLCERGEVIDSTSEVVKCQALVIEAGGRRLDTVISEYRTRGSFKTYTERMFNKYGRPTHGFEINLERPIFDTTSEEADE